MRVNRAHALLMVGLWASLALPVRAEDWFDYAMVSNTLDTEPSRLCMGVDNATIACPTYAPSLTTAGDISVTGNLSASKFIGDGSGLTGLSTASDRITSGTSSIIVSNSGHISFTTAGTERMVINSSGNVGIGTTALSHKLDVAGSINATGNLNLTTTVIPVTIQGTNFISRPLGGPDIRILDAANGYWRTFQIYTGDGTASTEKMRVTSNGNVGIGTTSPNKTLAISGTAEINSRTIIGGTGTPSATLQVSGSLLLAGSDSTTCTDAYIGILRRNPITGKLQVCK